MKTFVFVTALALAVTVALVAAPAEAAKKRKGSADQRVVMAKPDPYEVRDADGEILGRDPDPFIRLMLRKEGRIRDQTGR